MARYTIWDKVSDIYTPAGKKFTSEEWIEKYPWAGIEGVKMIVGSGIINGSVAMEFDMTKEHYAKRGVVFTDDMTDDEVLAAIEEFEDTPPSTEPTAEERTAAALEAMATGQTAESTAAMNALLTGEEV